MNDRKADQRTMAFGDRLLVAGIASATVVTPKMTRALMMKEEVKFLNILICLKLGLAEAEAGTVSKE